MSAAPVGTLLVFLITLAALVPFVTEPVPVDVTATGTTGPLDTSSVTTLGSAGRLR